MHRGNKPLKRAGTKPSEGNGIDWSELANWNEYTKILIGLFALVSPPIIIPLFLGIVSGLSTSEKRQVANAGSISFGITMWVFIFFGGGLLDVFGISIEVFRIAGGFLLFLIALDMLRSEAPSESSFEKPNAQKISSAFAAGIVPLAIPILAGPGAISTVVVFANIHEGIEHKILVSAVILTLVAYLVILLNIISVSERLIGRNVTIIFNKIMGLIICAIAFEFILDGIAGHFPQLETIHDAKIIESDH